MEKEKDKGKEKELNGPLKEEVNKRFEELFKKIGNNRQQLSFKVVLEQKEIIKELNKTKLDAKGREDVLRQVVAIEKMAAKQLPHLERGPTKAPAPPDKKPVPAATPAKKKK